MRSLSLIITTIFFFTVGSFCLKAIHPPALTPSIETTPAEDFMGLDAGLSGHEEGIVAALRKEPRPAENYFVSIIKQGLPDEVVAAAKSDYTRFFEERQSFLNSKEHRITVQEGKEGEAKAWTAQKIDSDNYVGNRLKLLERNARARAMEGLVVLETASAKDFLQELAKDDRFELQGYAQELLDR